MKALFIWNDSSKNYLVKSLLRTKQFSDVVEEFDIKQGFLLSSEEDWSKYNNNIKKVQNIYILVELGWDSDIFKGYKIGLEILKYWTGQKSPTIQFVSSMTRQFLFDNVSGKEQYLVKVFNHLDLLDISNEKLRTSHTAVDEWNFYKNYALTGAGILDDFSHRLETISSLQEKKSELSTIIKQMENQFSLVGEVVINHLPTFYEPGVNFKNFTIELRQLIDERKLIYKPHKSEKINISNNLKVMIVEDNKQHLDILRLSLSRYFSKDQIQCFSQGQEALLAYEKTPKDYNLVFVDLELLEGSFYQPIQGLRILKKICNKKMSSFTIITGLGRKGVQELLKIDIKKIVSKKQLYQYDTDKEVDNMLERMVKEFDVLERKIFENFGPNKSYFSWEGFKTVLSEYYSKKEYRKEVWTEANQVMARFSKRTLIKNDWPNKSKELISPKQKIIAKYTEFVETKFSTLLAHRLIVIYLASLHDFTLNCNNDGYSDYTKTLNDNDIRLNRGYLDRICLNYKKLSQGSETKYRIEKINMFPQELNFIQRLEEEKNVSFGNIYLEDNSPGLYEVFTADLKLDKKQTQALDVPNDVSSWTILNVISVIKTMFTDFISEGKKSRWYDTVERLVESRPFEETGELELEEYMPDIESQVNNIHQMLG